MSKRLTVVTLALAGVIYALMGRVTPGGGGGQVTPPPGIAYVAARLAAPIATGAATQPARCVIRTGVPDGGYVNLRACAGVNCAVVSVLTEGEKLTVLTAGDWAEVQTGNGVTGYLNSKFCKGQTP